MEDIAWQGTGRRGSRGGLWGPSSAPLESSSSCSNRDLLLPQPSHKRSWMHSGRANVREGNTAARQQLGERGEKWEGSSHTDTRVSTGGGQEVLQAELFTAVDGAVSSWRGKKKSINKWQRWRVTDWPQTPFLFLCTTQKIAKKRKLLSSLTDVSVGNKLHYSPYTS